ncbi:hypothetical protein CsatB_003570 [Cannabis sativa]
MSNLSRNLFPPSIVKQEPSDSEDVLPNEYPTLYPPYRTLPSSESPSPITPTSNICKKESDSPSPPQITPTSTICKNEQESPASDSFVKKESSSPTSPRVRKYGKMKSPRKGKCKSCLAKEADNVKLKFLRRNVSTKSENLRCAALDCRTVVFKIRQLLDQLSIILNGIQTVAGDIFVHACCPCQRTQRSDNY